MKFKYLSIVSLLMLSIGALGLGLFALSAELRPFLPSGSNAIERVMRDEQLNDDPRLSYSSWTGALDDCTKTLAQTQSLQMRYFGVDAPQKAKANCLALANAAIGVMPLSGHAWYLHALAGLDAQDSQGLSNDLTISRASTPHEEWLASLRFNLADENFASLSDGAADAYQADLAVLTQSSLGVKSLARRYLAQVESQPRIAAAVELAPANVQRSFLNAVRSQSQK